MKKCCFIGHRDSVGIEEDIYVQVEKLISTGITEFYSGGMGNFDKQCEKVAKELGGKLVLVAYSAKQAKPKDLLLYDKVIYPFGEKKYSKLDIPNRNKWLVNHCDVCLCYVHKDGGAKRTLDYAISLNKNIINITKG